MFGKFFAHAYNPCYEEFGAEFAKDRKICIQIVNCTLGNISEERKASIASTGVFLGFVPTLITFVGPSIRGISILSTERPILALLCAVGTTGFGFSKPFLLFNVRRTMQKFQNEEPHSAGAAQYSDLQDRYFSFMTDRDPARGMVKRTNIFLKYFQYFLGIGAVVNTVHNSYQIGLQTALAWNCSLSHFLPSMYTSFSFPIYLLVSVPLWWGLGYFKGTSPSTTVALPTEGSIKGFEEETQNLIRNETMGTHEGIRAWFKRRLRREITLSYAATPTQYDLVSKELKWYVVVVGVASGWVADATILAQYFLGTVILSNVLFVRLDDAVIIALRYCISAMVCRFIVAMELEGMKQAFRIEMDKRKAAKK
ncbi:hypothetical protein TWF730_006175 [Orbilia blumenaviensis]|uniref:ABC transmembrane type-1 domain-containing protein n=1 Tax=Orbilia blumenaviensis TaxID=1796055 RepID=A0AAV9TVM1_9PEZI